MLKKAFITTPFLRIFNLKKLAKLKIDASNKALSAVLYTQDNKGK
jgi:hypothetical protein